MALNGDANALRLCIEQLIPKVQRLPIIEPDQLSPSTTPEWRDAILRAAINGEIDIDDADKLIKFQAVRTMPIASMEIATTDPNEAARIYQQLMG